MALNKVEHILRYFNGQWSIKMMGWVEQHTRAYTILTFGTCQHITIDAARSIGGATTFPIFIVLCEFGKGHWHIT